MSVNSFSGQPAIPASYGFTAGKNKIINGDFGVNQRAFSSTGGNNVYTFDRWVTNINGSATISAQTFTAGSAPVAGYEGTNFLRLASSSQGAGNYVAIVQRVEDVRTFANQTITVSFWAKASSGTPKISAYTGQTFGSGGSAAVYTYGAAPTTTTSWARYAITINVPSISGKTIGSSSYIDVAIEVSDSFNANLGAQNATIDIWGVQAEAGATATSFQTATGTVQGELAACQRYYWRANAGSTYSRFSSAASADNTTTVSVPVNNPVPMRVVPTSLDYSNVTLYGGSFATVSTLTLAADSTTTLTLLGVTGTGLTQYRAYNLISNNTTSSYVGLSAEL